MPISTFSPIAVNLAARSATELGEVAEQVRANGAEPLAIDLDLMALTAAGTVVGQTLTKFGRIDALASIAGAVPGVDLFQMTDQQWNVGMELKLHAARRLTLRAWEALKSAKGAVVLMAGNAAEVPTASAAAIGVINAAIVALAKTTVALLQRCLAGDSFCALIRATWDFSDEEIRCARPKLAREVPIGSEIVC